ncbi:hypothetical protein F5Y07DRAFT_408327 [Xylaria sp. FL0933]|nr:hypothetical protein F5Y07DRAFT_408327 [Xylaria sp. FL0933]
MLTPAFVDVASSFHPVGNTPPVLLTKTIPEGQPVDILLLGCGDVRNTLFTCYWDARVMDVTCCDNQKAVIARNILLLTLLIDGNKSSGDLVWNLYYHMKIDNKSLELLRSQAQKLYDLSASMDAWQRGTYGSRLQFCDTATLEDVRAMWAFYAVERRGEEAQRFKLRFDNIIRKVNEKKKGSAVAKPHRAGRPSPLDLEPDLRALHSYYWKHGILELEATAIASAKHPNPMFMTPEDEATVHHGTDPLMGFYLTHARSLAEALTPLARAFKSLVERKNMVASAKGEFRDWAASYRKQKGSITLRFSTADALNLANTMQQRRSGGTDTAGLYRRQYDIRPLVLDGPDYVCGKAPLAFDVIDTSTLSDHIGPLVLFAATAPLLRNSLSAVLYANVFLKKSFNPMSKGVLDDLLCGHIPTLSSILGLSPVDYWTNTSHASKFDEGQLSVSEKQSHSYLRTQWKRPAGWVLDGEESETVVGSLKIRFGAEELARTMYDIYLNMFWDECPASRPAEMSLETMEYLSRTPYQRASFASVVHFIKSRVICDWEKTMILLMNLVQSRFDAPMGMRFFQELVAHLHMSGTYDATGIIIFRLSGLALRITPIDEKWGNIRDWKGIPEVVCVTLKVPKSNLDLFTEVHPVEARTHPMRCMLRGDAGSIDYCFLACHLAFGELMTKGERHTDSFKVSVVQAADGGCDGSAPLIVSFYVPTSILLRSPGKTDVIFGTHSTPASAMCYFGTSRVDIAVYQTGLDNGNNVFVTRHPPGLDAFPTVSAFAEPEQESITDMNAGAATASLTAHTNYQGHITYMTARVDLQSDKYKSALTHNRKVQTQMLSASEVGITLERKAKLTIGYPFAVAGTSLWTKVDHDNHSFEVVAKVETGSGWERYAELLCTCGHVTIPDDFTHDLPSLQRVIHRAVHEAVSLPLWPAWDEPMLSPNTNNHVQIQQ